MSKLAVAAGGLPTNDETRAALSSEVANLLTAYPSLTTIPIQWGDMDAYRHLNNVYYMRIFETGRLAYFINIWGKHVGEKRAVDFLSGTGIGIVVADTLMKYKFPVTFPDTITVGIKLDLNKVYTDRFDLIGRLVSHKHGIVVAEGRTTLVCYDHQAKKKADIPLDFLEAIRDTWGFRQPFCPTLLSLILSRSKYHYKKMNLIRRLFSTANSTGIKSVPVGAFASVEQIRQSLPLAVSTVLKDYPSLITLPVQWGEQDSYGHLNNVYYMRYFESGRLAYFEQVLAKHIPAPDVAAFINAAALKSIGPIVKSIVLNYRRVVTYPDTVTVGITADLSSVTRDRFVQKCCIVSHKHAAVVADGSTTVVTYDYAKGVKADIPPSVLAAIRTEQNDISSSLQQ
ncbi:hypothetical protein HK100_006454 [Physocladia obscura]|uniref:Thioesterase domain-containing protein n=1 Tax=Physocladia obscura TaxID=109957 RepID=A0AAD5XHP1_9FUNG|nr:hypothetical protein HK100_006454 [Physocladia obscura]